LEPIASDRETPALTPPLRERNRQAEPLQSVAYYQMMTASPYSGPVRIFDTNGNLLAIGIASLEDDEANLNWGGTLEVMAGTGVAGKALVVDLELEGRKGRAQLLPVDNRGEAAHSRVVGLGQSPLVPSPS
jgi:hypothetical protein